MSSKLLSISRIPSRRMVSSFLANTADPSKFKSVQYTSDLENGVATLTLNRPHVFNAIDENTPLEIEQSVQLANDDPKIKVLVVTGSGKAFCSGYDLKKFAEVKRGTVLGSQKMPWDPYEDYKFMARCTEAYMSLWRSLKPTIAHINGDCIAGGSDIALCCDITFIANDARIGYPPARIWGCPTTAMWYYRLGVEKAKRMLLTGQLITGEKAVEMGLIGDCASRDKLEQVVKDFVDSIKTVPTNQLFFQKQMINNAVEMQGLLNTQRLATVFDGMTRHTPEGVKFQELCHEKGFKAAVLKRDMFPMSKL